ncbi:uncharacterized protein Dyak_GE27480 [Drosophila yakuba]|uniref:Uncharacterized protein n=1 Tax=Drosophila yakuba TaxID=7245 RepID=A0A0R1EAY9_DROYA|nr:uncharacterized protein Dyak_GE27480 [Drosophila yakuba]
MAVVSILPGQRPDNIKVTLINLPKYSVLNLPCAGVRYRYRYAVHNTTLTMSNLNRNKSIGSGKTMDSWENGFMEADSISWNHGISMRITFLSAQRGKPPTESGRTTPPIHSQSFGAHLLSADKFFSLVAISARV